MDGSGTADDLTYIASMTNDDRYTYSGHYLKLMNDIAFDKSQQKNFQGIATFTTAAATPEGVEGGVMPVFSLTLGENVSIASEPAVSYEGTDYYVLGTAIPPHLHRHNITPATVAPSGYG